MDCINEITDYAEKETNETTEELLYLITTRGKLLIDLEKYADKKEMEEIIPPHISKNQWEKTKQIIKETKK